ncbi:MAG: efflux RND transporter periplasmic adaptor subunit [Bacteroidales bacterium]|jgi:Cu(I)/Ag(I) efflux system membrane fusion protein
MKTKIQISNREIKIIAITLVAGLLLGWLFFHGGTGASESAGTMDEHVHKEEQVIWTCSMHPQIRMDKPDQCPICGMDLIPLDKGHTDTEAVSPDEIGMTQAAIKLADIQTIKVRKDYPDKEVFLLGKVKADERNIAELTARFGGRIEKLFINFTGQKVSKGEKLATIYSPAMVTAQRELLEAMEYRESNTDFYRAARNKLKLWDLTEEQINDIEQKGDALHYFDILSPITGTVTMRHVASGDYFKEGTPLFQVTDLSRVWVLFEAYESDLPWIKLRDRVKFRIKSLPGEDFEGRVAFIDPVIDPRTRVAQVRLVLGNPELKLKPEMFADGVLTSSIAGNNKDLLIPKTAVLWTGKRAVVYVRVPEREQPVFQYRQIVLGPEAGKFYVVEEGLDEGEEVAVNGVFKIDAAAQLAGKPSMMNPSFAEPAEGSAGEGRIFKKYDRENKTADSEHNKIKEKELKMPDMDDKHRHNSNVEHEMFKVAGNCSMCKARIEKAALSIEGVNAAVWSEEAKMMHVSFNTGKTSMGQIHKAIAKAGHDTEKETAPEEIYRGLPPCCKYSRE